MKETTNFKQIADEMRRLAIEGIYSAKSGHPVGSLSI